MITNRKYKWGSRTLEFLGNVNDDMWLEVTVSLAFWLQVIHYSCSSTLERHHWQVTVVLNPASKVEFAERNSLLMYRVTFMYFFAIYVCSSHYLTFRGPCIVIYSYNKSQRDALFLSFILVKNSTCFGQIYCPSSGVSTLYTQQ